MKDFILKHWNNKELPAGVRLITVITSIRWIGWGFAENLIPVLIYTFGHSLARSGLINSVYSIALILVVPIVGFAADRMRATTLIAIGLVIYLFVGLSYFLVGITGLVIFIIIARFLNGISYSFDSIGRETYIMRYTPPAIAATAFGYFDTVANFWWIAASLAGIGLLAYFSIPTLLFMITPTALIALIMVLRFRKKEPPITTLPNKKDLGKLSLAEIRSWSKVLKNLTIFNFFITAIGAVIAFFVPIEAYKAGASLGAVVIMGVIATIPTLLGWNFGKLFDIKGSKMFTLGLLSFAVLTFLLVFLRSYAWQVFIYFMVNMVLELLSVGSLELISTHTKPEHFGKVDGFIKSTEYIGAVVGPLMAGILMDAYGFSSAYVVFTIILLFLAVMFYILQRKGYMERPVILEEPMMEK